MIVLGVAMYQKIQVETSIVAVTTRMASSAGVAVGLVRF